jgi:hypothetical protein
MNIKKYVSNFLKTSKLFLKVSSKLVVIWMDEVEYRKELLELERRYYDKMDKYQEEYRLESRKNREEIKNTEKFYLTVLSLFLVVLGVLLTLLKFWRV